ncbi:penicillin-binding protein 2 [Nitrosomonas sp. Nm166]|uniref:peptidoglycan D,D-transpeptidase FtsI family protein n=1 Tax=Nitrosomonas sp. Nm166 TaxID=1881054 RepID=UPI0008E48D81|nr:penicillin-binding transpeptidase domain-containing protein [Nitrosomonas sp. Nm166]SFE63166.1 cell division protein FtsI (penicillin-binding protein 3) [Nitrosomonas sp. Nm166]
MIKNEAPPIKLSAWRSFLLMTLLVLGLISLAGRAAYLQGMHNDFLQEKGESRYSRVVEMNADRGMITDRNGQILAISSPIASVHVDPKVVRITPEQLKQLSTLLEINSQDINERINRQNSRFVYLKRQVVPDIAEKVMKLKIPGIYLTHESKRYYPEGEFAAHVLGFTDINDEGQEGVERGWQETLAGELGSRRVIKDNKGRIIENIEKIRLPKEGQDLILSIDRRIQYRAHAELKEAVKLNKAKAGSIVVLDAQTGEILALTNLPVYNPNNRSTINNERIRNRALIDTFEPGSTLKPFTVAIAMEVGKVNSNTVMQTSPGVLQVGRKTIRDVNNKGELTVAQVIQQSSNVGTAKIALSLAPQTMWEMFNRSGFGTLTNSGFPGEASGILRSYNAWRPIEQATMSYGHGISTSLMQLARAYTIFTSGGELKPISLLKQNMPVMGQRVISRDTALALNYMLELATKPGGTAPLAQINGYRVAGKTGTAHKLIDGQYAKKHYISTFVGYAPASYPRLIIAVMIDEPSAGKYFGGAVAAPVFSKVMSSALRILNIPPDAPANNVITFTATPEMDDEG